MRDATKPGLPTAVTMTRGAVESETRAREFGGTFGAAFIMTLSHFLMLYLWLAWRFYDGSLFYPKGLSDAGPFFARNWELVASNAAPSWGTFGIYWAFLIVEGVMAAYLPGVRIKGLPIPSRSGIRREASSMISSWAPG